MSQKFCCVLVSDNGESWALNGDDVNDNEENEVLPQMLNDGWLINSVTAGSGSKDDTSYWLVALVKAS